MVQSTFSAQRSAYRSAYRIYPRQVLATIAHIQKAEAVARKAESALSALAVLA